MSNGAVRTGLVLDLFAGPGGWSEGMRAWDIRAVGLELDRDACLTRRAAGHVAVRTDVAAYPSDAFRDVWGLVASPPCQAFSMAGKREGMKDLAAIHRAVEAARSGWRDELRAGPWADDRSRLILEPLRWAWTLRPRWIACEQVPPAFPVWEHMADVLRGWDYDARAVKLVAADYGVPQTRERAFLLAHRDGVHVPEPTHAKKPEPSLFGRETLPWVSMADALGWVPGGRAMDRRVGGYAADAEPIDDERPAPTPTLNNGRECWMVRTSFGEPHRGPEAGSPKPEFDPTEAPCRTVNGKTADWTVTRPATTLCGGFSPDIVTGPGARDWSNGGTSRQDSEGAIRITLPEAAILQGFRADYPFQGTKTSQFRQCGNAVPPLWAEAIIGALSRLAALHPL